MNKLKKKWFRSVRRSGVRHAFCLPVTSQKSCNN